MVIEFVIKRINLTYLTIFLNRIYERKYENLLRKRVGCKYFECIFFGKAKLTNIFKDME